MTGAERTLTAMLLICAVGLFALAASTRTAPLRILGYFLAAAVAWAGVAYVWAVLTLPT